MSNDDDSPVGSELEDLESRVLGLEKELCVVSQAILNIEQYLKERDKNA